MKIGIIVTSGCIIGLMCIAAIVYATHNYRIFRSSLATYLAKWIEYCGPFIRVRESLLMKNTGDDPNQPIGDINYIDYIESTELFWYGGSAQCQN